MNNFINTIIRVHINVYFYLYTYIVTNANCVFQILNVKFCCVLGTRDSDTNGNRRRTTYKGYGKSSKVIVDKKPVVDDGILTWKVPGIKIDVSNYLYMLYTFTTDLRIIYNSFIVKPGISAILLNFRLIQTTKSVPQKVVLKKVTFRSTGVYRCEVTSRVRQIETRRGYERQRYTPGNFRMKESINRMTVVGK